MDELIKTAVLGLQNAGDYDDKLVDDCKAILQNQSYDNDARRFLDASALTLFQQEYSAIPQIDSFEELPDIPDETRIPMSNQKMTEFSQLLQKSSALRFGLQHLLQTGEYLPDTHFAQLMSEMKLELSNRQRLALVMSARSHWLLTMNGQWRAYMERVIDVQWLSQTDLENEDLLVDFSNTNVFLQTYFLLGLTVEQRVGFTQKVWSHCKVEGRQLLLRFAREDLKNNPQLVEWLAEQSQDKSNHIKREIIRTLVTTRTQWADEIYQAGVAQLALYVEKKLLRKIEVQVPEELTSELKNLAIFDQDYLNTNEPKPVQRLGQLLVILGPDNWGKYLDCASESAMERLLKSRFGKELRLYLLEAAIVHEHHKAFKTWCAKVDVYASDSVQLILERLSPNHGARIINWAIAEKRANLINHSKIWLQQSEQGQFLTGTQASTFFALWCQMIAKGRRFYPDYDYLYALMGWMKITQLETKDWQALQDAEKIDGGSVSLMQTLFNFSQGK